MAKNFLHMDENAYLKPIIIIEGITFYKIKYLSNI